MTLPALPPKKPPGTSWTTSSAALSAATRPITASRMSAPRPRWICRRDRNFPCRSLQSRPLIPLLVPVEDDASFGFPVGGEEGRLHWQHPARKNRIAPPPPALPRLSRPSAAASPSMRLSAMPGTAAAPSRTWCRMPSPPRLCRKPPPLCPPHLLLLRSQRSPSSPPAPRVPS